LKVVTVLRSGKVIGTKETEQSPPHGASKSKVNKMERKYPPPPFPQRLVKPRNEVKSQVPPDEASTFMVSEMEKVNAPPFP
jgi:hypothetical protein